MMKKAATVTTISQADLATSDADAYKSSIARVAHVDATAVTLQLEGASVRAHTASILTSSPAECEEVLHRQNQNEIRLIRHHDIAILILVR